MALLSWNYITVPQINVDNRNLTWPRGKVLGGSTAVNGMYLVRPSSIEMDNWMYLQGAAPGASAWGWDSMFTAMKKVCRSYLKPCLASY